MIPVWKGPRLLGKEDGFGVLVWPDGQIDEGHYVCGLKQGNWIEKCANGGVDQGNYVDGVKQGTWVETLPNGVRQEGEYIKTGRGYSKHGKWIRRNLDGFWTETEFRKGQVLRP